jgi:hypothetical protein
VGLRPSRATGDQEKVMTAILWDLLVVVVIAGAAVLAVRRRADQAPADRDQHRGSTLFAFPAKSFSAPALDYALCLARAGDDTVDAVSLHTVPLTSAIAAAPGEVNHDGSLTQLIEARGHAFDVTVCTRAARGRSYRHALRDALATRAYDRIVIAAAQTQPPQITHDDIRWLLDTAPGEVLVLRPGLSPATTLSPSGSSRQQRDGPTLGRAHDDDCEHHISRDDEHAVRAPQPTAR